MNTQNTYMKSVCSAGFALLLTGFTFAQSESITLSASATQKIQNLNLNAGDPETDWNCLDVVVGGRSLRVVMPRFIPPTGDYTEEILRLVRSLVPETVDSATGPVAGIRDNGTLFGVEFKVFAPDPNPVPAPPLRLAETADLVASSGTALGTMYCFNEDQYLARVGTLGIAEKQIVWTGNLGHGLTLEEKSVQVSGNDNHVKGSLKANGSIRISGSDHNVEGALSYRTSLVVQFGSHTLGAQVQEPAAPFQGLPSPVSWYQSQCNHSFTGDVSISNDGMGGMVTSTGVPISGLIYSTGMISIEGNDIVAEATFVAEKGVEFNGNDCLFTPAVDELLACSTGSALDEAISIPGSYLTLVGSLVAENVRVAVTGSHNQMFGQLRGKRVRIMGTNNTLADVYQP